MAPRYPIELWNQYSAAIDGSAKTNNVSEGWHNRFRILVAKHHTDIYSACVELQKEQGATEISLVELSLGKKIRAAPKKNGWRLKTVLRELPISICSINIS